MLNEIILIFFFLLTLIYSIIIHEIFHGVAALWLGDNTAKYAGRITLNPFKHIDMMWTIVIPISMFLITSLFGKPFAFGGAKPVPYNPYNLRNQRWGPALVALAGPGINIVIALLFAVFARFISLTAGSKFDLIQNLTNWSFLSDSVKSSFGIILFILCSFIIFWNVLIAVFNLFPIPPLDGSKILFSIIPIKIETMAILEQYGFAILLIFIFVLPGLLSSILDFFWMLFFNLAI